MKLTVLTWLKDSSIGLIGKTIELLFRVLLCCTPLWVFLLIIQFRNKASKVSNISVYTNPMSVWQHVFPGFILVAINPNVLKESYELHKRSFQKWVADNKYAISFIFMLLIVLLILIKGRSV